MKIITIKYKDEYEAEIIYNGCINIEEDPADCIDYETVKGVKVS